MKLVVAYELKQHGYRVANEIDGLSREIDVVWYGTEDTPIAVEVELNLHDDALMDEFERYGHGQQYRDMFLLDVDEISDGINAARE